MDLWQETHVRMPLVYRTRDLRQLSKSWGIVSQRGTRLRDWLAKRRSPSEEGLRGSGHPETEDKVRLRATVCRQVLCQYSYAICCRHSLAGIATARCTV